jgi:hypothetical protein
MNTFVDESLKAKQLDVAREFKATKPFLGGEAIVPMRVDKDVYEAARIANLEEYGGENCWDDPEFCGDMMRRHPEIRTEVRGNRWCMSPMTGQGTARNRFGKVKSRTRIRGHLKITDEGGVRTVKDTLKGTEYRVDIATGKILEPLMNTDEHRCGVGEEPSNLQPGTGGSL